MESCWKEIASWSAERRTITAEKKAINVYHNSSWPLFLPSSLPFCCFFLVIASLASFITSCLSVLTVVLLIKLLPLPPYSLCVFLFLSTHSSFLCLLSMLRTSAVGPIPFFSLSLSPLCCVSRRLSASHTISRDILTDQGISTHRQLFSNTTTGVHARLRESAKCDACAQVHTHSHTDELMKNL